MAEKRGAQVALVMGRLLPKGYSRESFTGKKANVIDSARIAELKPLHRERTEAHRSSRSCYSA